MPSVAHRLKTALVRTTVVHIAVVMAALPMAAAAQVIGIVLDPKPTLSDGTVSRNENPVSDSVVFFEFAGAKAKKLGQVNVPTSFFGPPSSVAVSADKKFAIVTSSRK